MAQAGIAGDAEALSAPGQTGVTAHARFRGMTALHKMNNLSIKPI
jgi:hypothetical protein